MCQDHSQVHADLRDALTKLQSAADDFRRTLLDVIENNACETVAPVFAGVHAVIRQSLFEASEILRLYNNVMVPEDDAEVSASDAMAFAMLCKLAVPKFGGSVAADSLRDNSPHLH